MMNPQAIINLDNLTHNVNEIKKTTGKKIMAVVKSDAYGLGIKKIVPWLSMHGIDYFALNDEMELIENRETFKNKKVLLLESVTSYNYDRIFNISKEVRITINNNNDIYTLINYLEKTKLINIVYVHIAIDTKMKRLGFEKIEDVKHAIELIKSIPNIILEGIYTHFASEEGNAFLEQQKRFLPYLCLFPFTIVHTASSRFLTRPIIGNYVRVGMALYQNVNNIPINLKNVLNVYAKPINKMCLEKNDTIGYDDAYYALKKEKAYILSMGYFEGVLPPFIKMKNKEYKRCGKVCMNHSFYIADESEISNTTFLKIFPFHDKINEGKLYKTFVSYQNIKKVYISTYDKYLPKAFKSQYAFSTKIKKRRRSDKIISIRAIKS